MLFQVVTWTWSIVMVRAPFIWLYEWLILISFNCMCPEVKQVSNFQNFRNQWKGHWHVLIKFFLLRGWGWGGVFLSFKVFNWGEGLLSGYRLVLNKLSETAYSPLYNRHSRVLNLSIKTARKLLLCACALKMTRFGTLNFVKFWIFYFASHVLVMNIKRFLWGIHICIITLKVLNFWKFTSYCSLKPIWSGMGEVVPSRTSPTLYPHPLPCASIVATSTLRANRALFCFTGCDVDLCSPETGITPLHIAVNCYSDASIFLPVLRLLLQGKCNLDAIMVNSWTSSDTSHLYETPLYRAIDARKSDLAVILLQHGANPNCECPHDLTILHKACHRLDLNVIEVLLHCGIAWRHETWLDIDIHHCGINRDLLHGQMRDIPPILRDNTELYFLIMEARCNPRLLSEWCRDAIRTAMRSQLNVKVKELGLPPKLQDFVMLKTNHLYRWLQVPGSHRYTHKPQEIFREYILDLEDHPKTGMC